MRQTGAFRDGRGHRRGGDKGEGGRDHGARGEPAQGSVSSHEPFYTGHDVAPSCGHGRRHAIGASEG